MRRTTNATTPVAGGRPEVAPIGRRRRQGASTLGLLAVVVVVDQATKWWAWRHIATAIVNTGGTWLIGDRVSGWFSDPVWGPLLDVLDVGLLCLAGAVLVRRPRPPVFLVAGALMISGLASNLLDRLGVHALTAPHSYRGAVDFLPIGSVHVNVADVVIAAATLLYLVARPSPERAAAPDGDAARSLTSASSR
jgi:lipoprotein signal peptidase